MAFPSEFWLFLSVIFVLLCFLFALLFTSSRFLTLYYGIPFIGIEFPFIFGNTKDKQLALQFADLYKKHRQPIIGIRILVTKPSLIISDLALAKLILVEKFDYFQNRGLFYNEKDDPLSAILGTVDHDQWKPMKRKLTPAFTSMKMKEIFPQLKNMCDGLVVNLIGIMDNGEQIVEIFDTFSRFTVDAIGAIAFGNSSEDSAKRLRDMVVKSKQPYIKFPWNRIAVAHPEFARFIGMRKHSKEVTDFFVNYVSEIVQYRRESNEEFNDFMQSLIDAELGIPRITAIAIDLLSAGYSDSTSTLAYCLYELAMNNDIQTKARDEVQHFLENQEFTYDVLQCMPYIQQIIKETERKYPIAGIATRVATKSFKIPETKITIPKGMKVFIPIYAIHHDETYHRDPEVFDPDRFSEQRKHEHPAYSFLPFGKGQRMCIGYRFAEMLIGIGLVSLLKNFEFSTCAKTQMPIQFNQNKNTLHPKCGLTLKVRRI